MYLTNGFHNAVLIYKYLISDIPNQTNKNVFNVEMRFHFEYFDHLKAFNEQKFA